MEEAFGTLVWVVAGVGAIVAVFTLVATGRSYREIGGGGLVRDHDDDGGDCAVPGAAGAGSAAGSADERDEEICQMLEARNARRVRRGEAPQEVEAEPAALARGDSQHVVARNARRVRAGSAPLDVDQEIERRIRDLT